MAKALLLQHLYAQTHAAGHDESYSLLISHLKALVAPVIMELVWVFRIISHTYPRVFPLSGNLGAICFRLEYNIVPESSCMHSICASSSCTSQLLSVCLWSFFEVPGKGVWGRATLLFWYKRFSDRAACFACSKRLILFGEARQRVCLSDNIYTLHSYSETLCISLLRIPISMKYHHLPSCILLPCGPNFLLALLVNLLYLSRGCKSWGDAIFFCAVLFCVMVICVLRKGVCVCRCSSVREGGVEREWAWFTWSC